MLVDLILGRKAGSIAYTPKGMYEYCMSDKIYHPIAATMDYGTEEDVKEAICNYIDEEGYSQQIKEYVKSANWIELWN